MNKLHLPPSMEALGSLGRPCFCHEKITVIIPSSFTFPISAMQPEHETFQFSERSVFKKPTPIQRHDLKNGMTSLQLDQTNTIKLEMDLETDATMQQTLLAEALTMSNDGFFRMLQEANPELSFQHMSDLEGLNIEMSSLMAPDMSGSLMSASSHSLMQAINLASSVQPQDQQAESLLQSVVAIGAQLDANEYPLMSMSQTFKGFSGESENGDADINDMRSSRTTSALSEQSSSDDSFPSRKKASRKEKVFTCIMLPEQVCS